MGMPVEPQFNQRDFRIRKTDVTVAANAAFDASDPALNVGTTVDADQAFRIRFNVEVDPLGDIAKGHKIQYSKNSGSYIDCPIEVGVVPGVVSLAAAVDAAVYAATAYTDGTAATQLLGSDSPYVNGEAVESDNTSGTVSAGTSDFFECEYLVVIRRWYDNYLENSDGDTFDFRLVMADSTAYTYDTNSGYDNIPRATLNIPLKYIGGTMVETPIRIGPFLDGNGNLYWVMENTSNNPDFNRILLLKSTDGGDTWAEPTATGRPTFNDLECADIVVEDGDILHILTSDGLDVEYHEYNMSSAASNPDTWQTIDDSLSTGGSGSIGVQAAALVRRPAEADFVAFYNRFDAGSTLDHAFYRIGVGGTWGTEQTLDTGDIHAISAVLGFDGSGNDLVHVVYHDEEPAVSNTLWHRSLNNVDTLSATESITTDLGSSTAEEVPTSQAVHWTSGGDEIMMVAFRTLTDGYLFTSTVTNDGAPSTPIEVAARAVMYDGPVQANDSRQVVASLALDGTDIYCHFADLATGDLWRTKSDNGAAWDTEVEETDGLSVQWIRGEVFTHNAANGSATVIGYIYDNGSLGGMGQQWYAEYFLRAGGAIPLFPRRKQTTVRM